MPLDQQRTPKLIQSPKVPNSINSINGVRSKEEDPLNPIRVRGYAQMLECWEKRDAQCFWDNFWWLFFQTQYIDCKNFFPPQPDPTCGSLPPGIEKTKCLNRLITSGYCYVNDQNLFVRWTSPEAGDRIYCKNAPIIELFNSCKEECAKNPPTQNKVEAGGCDGYTVWCWCNSAEGTFNPNNTDSHLP